MKLIFINSYRNEREIAAPATYAEAFDEINKFVAECNSKKRPNEKKFEIYYYHLHLHENKTLCIDVGSHTEFFHLVREDNEDWPDDFPKEFLPKEEPKVDLTKTSKFLSLILRHKPEEIGIELDNHGWANVNELLSGMNITMDVLEEIVTTDEKKRYSFNDNKTLIRANQGHSVPVDVELKECKPPSILYHGTGEKYKESIEESGLIPKSRLHVHLSKDLCTASDIGKRHGHPVIFAIAAFEMYEQGHKFYLSENGVWLTDEVPAKYMLCLGSISCRDKDDE